LIKHFRIDERLIHGQVVLAWSKVCSITHIVVANDSAATNSAISQTLKMATPPGMKPSIKTVKDAIELLNDPRCEPLSILLLVDNPKDAYEVITNVNGIDSLNVGNYGRFNASEEGRVRMAEGLYANEEDKEWLKKILDTGIDVYVQVTPDKSKTDVKRLFEKEE